MMPVLLLLAALLAGQDHAGHAMPGMAMPAQADSHAAHRPPPADDPHAGHDQPPASDPHAGHAMATGDAPAPAATAAGTDLPPGDAPAPPAPPPHAADRIWGAAAMAPARAAMMAHEGGGQRFARLLVDMAEVQAGDGGTYRWEGEGWWGGDIHRLVVKSEGEGGLSGRLGSAEVQALYSRAVGPYFNLQAGIRHDIRPQPGRSFAVLGVEGLAPYWFEVDAAAFLSTRGELTARIEGYYDQRVTQRLIAQPRIELNLSAQDIRATATGSGLTDAELGLRLRYEVAREFAPYVGVHWERRFGDTRRLARAAGGDGGGIGVVAGIRAWF